MAVIEPQQEVPSESSTLRVVASLGKDSKPVGVH